MNDQAEKTDERVAPPEALRDAFGKIGELRAYASQYVSAKLDLLKLSARNAAILTALAVVGLVAVLALIVIAIVMLLSGLAGAIAAGLGGRAWAGNLIVGGGLILIFGVGAFVGLMILKKSWLKATVKKYETQQTQQRASFGHSSRDRAKI